MPTVAESGGPAGYEVTGWTRIAAPKGLPKPSTDKIRARRRGRAGRARTCKQRFATFGYEPFPATPEQFNAFIAAESAKSATVVKRSKASLDWRATSSTD